MIVVINSATVNKDYIHSHFPGGFRNASSATDWYLRAAVKLFGEVSEVLSVAGYFTALSMAMNAVHTPPPPGTTTPLPRRFHAESVRRQTSSWSCLKAC